MRLANPINLLVIFGVAFFSGYFWTSRAYQPYPLRDRLNGRFSGNDTIASQSALASKDDWQSLELSRNRRPFPTGLHFDKDQWIQYYGYPFTESGTNGIDFSSRFFETLGIDHLKQHKLTSLLQQTVDSIYRLSRHRVASIKDDKYSEAFTGFLFPPLEPAQVEEISATFRNGVAAELEGWRYDFLWAAVEHRAHKNSILRGFGELGLKVYFHVGDKAQGYGVRYYEQLVDRDGNEIGPSTVHVTSKGELLPEHYRHWFRVE